MRSALNAFDMFTKTGAVRDGEVVWRLDEGRVQTEQAALAEKASRQRAKPLSGAQRRKLKRQTTSDGVVDEGGEEGAGRDDGGQLEEEHDGVGVGSGEAPGTQTGRMIF